MKKRYINPETTIVTLKYNTLLMISGPAVDEVAMPGGEGIIYDGDGFEDGEYDV